jgi:hypothetical protein
MVTELFPSQHHVLCQCGQSRWCQPVPKRERGVEYAYFHRPAHLDVSDAKTVTANAFESTGGRPYTGYLHQRSRSNNWWLNDATVLHKQR